MNTLPQAPDTDELAATVRLHKRLVKETKAGYMNGFCTYDELATAGKELSQAMFEYASAKFPTVKSRKMPYQAIIL